jgi:Gas vesicle synthesis protein GvpL/GvpF
MSDELGRLAREAAPDVLAQALEQARERAVARLADLLTDAILAQALATTVAPHPPEEPPLERAAPRTDGPAGADAEEALYAYGIAAADLPVPEDGPTLTEGTRIERVTAGDLALLVSRVTPDQLRVDEDDLSESGRLATLARGHDAVVRAAATAGPVLPLRFGTVVADEAAARRLLDEHGAAARTQLRRIGDTREWGVKLVRRLGVEPVPTARPADRTEVTGTEYLTRRRQALQEHDSSEQAAGRASDLLEETLRPYVAESLRRGGAPGSSLLLDLAFLVPPDSEAGFLAAAADLRERLDPDGLEVEVSGPWPPYSFASLDRGGAGRA